MRRACLAVFAACSTQIVLGAPSNPQSYSVYSAGGLTILTYNDLSNSPKNGSAAVLVPYSGRFRWCRGISCRKLGETLWNPDTARFADGLNSSLSYQIWQGVFPKSQLFWVSGGGAASGGCRAIDYRGDPKGS